MGIGSVIHAELGVDRPAGVAASSRWRQCQLPMPIP
jgi:hypothetical protein